MKFSFGTRVSNFPMLFKPCAEGEHEHEPGKTYHVRDAGWVYTSALRSITPKVRPPAALLEVRLEGVTICVGGGVIGKQMTVVCVLTAEEKSAAWTGVLAREDGTQEWYRNGQLHGEGDLPAIVWANGDRVWYRNGLRHREGDLPALIGGNGDQVWSRNGQLHRKGEGDPPAVVCADGTQQWYLNGVRVI